MRKLAFAFLSLFLIGCISGPAEVVTENQRFPTDAKNVKHVGNNWYTFDFGQNKFLYKIVPADQRGNVMANAGPSDEVQNNLDELGKAIEEGIRQNQARPFRPLDDPAPRPPRDEKDRSI